MLTYFILNVIKQRIVFLNFNIQATGASLVDQYTITLVHIVGFKMIKNRTNILGVLGG